MLEYEANIRAELAGGERASGSAHGWFTCAANEHHKHEVSAQDKTIIAAALAATCDVRGEGSTKERTDGVREALHFATLVAFLAERSLIRKAQ